MKVQLITPEKILFEGEAAMVTAPGAEGEFGVLAGHAPLISTLRPGTIIIDTEDGQRQEFAVTGGVAEVTPEKCILLVEGISTAEAKAA